LQALSAEPGGSARPLPLRHRGRLSVDAAGATTLVVTVTLPAEQALAQRRGTPLPIRFVVDDPATGAQAQTSTTFLPG
jgi:hypothetical protein